MANGPIKYSTRLDEITRLGVDSKGNSIHDNSKAGRKRRLETSKQYVKGKLNRVMKTNRAKKK